MRVLVVLAHPVPESFATPCTPDRVGPDRAGHEVRQLDLYGIGFDPVLGPQDRRDYHTPGSTPSASRTSWTTSAGPKG